MSLTPICDNKRAVRLKLCKPLVFTLDIGGSLTETPQTASDDPPKENNPIESGSKHGAEEHETRSTVCFACEIDAESEGARTDVLAFLLAIIPGGYAIRKKEAVWLFLVDEGGVSPALEDSGEEFISNLAPLTKFGKIDPEDHDEFANAVEHVFKKVMMLRWESGDEDPGTFLDQFLGEMITSWD